MGSLVRGGLSFDTKVVASFSPDPSLSELGAEHLDMHSSPLGAHMESIKDSSCEFISSLKFLLSATVVNVDASERLE
jgi:hypothetical protein